MLRRTLARAAVSRTSLASQMSQRSFAVGVVKWFNDAKGIGFIQNEESGTDVFVHQSSIKSNTFRKLEEGERVRPWQPRGAGAWGLPLCASPCRPTSAPQLFPFSLSLFPLTLTPALPRALALAPSPRRSSWTLRTPRRAARQET